MNFGPETNDFHYLVKFLKQKFFTFPQPRYVLIMFLNFGHFLTPIFSPPNGTKGPKDLDDQTIKWLHSESDITTVCQIIHTTDLMFSILKKDSYVKEQITGLSISVIRHTLHFDN